MLSIEETKKLLNDTTISDEQVEQIRDEIRALVEVIFQSWLEKEQAKKVSKQIIN